MSAGPITTHVLDTALGQPAAGLRVELRLHGETLGSGRTDAQGRLAGLLPEAPIEPGEYELHFDTAEYAESVGGETFYPRVVVAFTLTTTDEHVHVPLLLSPHGYTTYRGSR